MLLQTANKYAVDIHNWLKPTWTRCEITGSVRRQRPQCSDIDLCLIAKATTYKDLLGVEIGTQNHTWQFLVNYVNNFNPRSMKPGQRLPEILTGADRAGHRMTIQIPACQLDIWFARENNWACKLINSTGSMEHNIWLAQRAADHGLHWFVSEGLARLHQLKDAGIGVKDYQAGQLARAAGLILDTPDESAFYQALGLRWIEPANRELPYLKRHIDSGL